MLIAVSGAAANSASVNIQNNPRRHSLLYCTQSSGTATIAGVQVQLPSTNAQMGCFGIFTWDNLGDAMNQISNLTSGAASTSFIVIEVYREEVP